MEITGIANKIVHNTIVSKFMPMAVLPFENNREESQHTFFQSVSRTALFTPHLENAKDNTFSPTEDKRGLEKHIKNMNKIGFGERKGKMIYCLLRDH